MGIPIGIRTFNRPVYLATTLNSLEESITPPDVDVIILDDISTDPISLTYYKTSDAIPINQVWPNTVEWVEHTNNKIFRFGTEIIGINGKYPIIQPDVHKGDIGGLWWCIKYLFDSYPLEDAIILTEGDVIFHKDWYKALVDVFYETRDVKGPNGNDIGIVTAFDMYLSDHYKDASYGFKQLKYNPAKDKYNAPIGGINYIISRKLFDCMQDVVNKDYTDSKKPGDVALFDACGRNNFNIATTSPSYVQHIGINSIVKDTTDWRYCTNFKK